MAQTKEQRAAYMRKYRALNPERIRAIYRKSAAKNREKLKEYYRLRHIRRMSDPESRERHNAAGRKWAKENPERHRATVLAWQKRHPEKVRLWYKARNIAKPLEYKAHNLLGTAVKRKKLEKSTTCEECGTTGMIHGHHHDYSKPLEVRWLCPLCHKKVHA